MAASIRVAMDASNKSPQSEESIARAFSLLDRAVWIVTAQAGKRRGGLLATWVSQSSLDPERPTVLIGLGPTHNTCALVEAAGCFGLHLLRGDQAPLALPFCLASGRDVDKLATAPHQQGEAGAPLLKDCLARLECRVYARLETGDRTYFWADVLAGETFGEELPLSEQGLIAAATPEQRAILKRDWLADIEKQRVGTETWRGSVPPLLAPPQANSGKE